MVLVQWGRNGHMLVDGICSAKVRTEVWSNLGNAGLFPSSLGYHDLLIRLNNTAPS